MDSGNTVTQCVNNKSHELPGGSWDLPPWLWAYYKHSSPGPQSGCQRACLLYALAQSPVHTVTVLTYHPEVSKYISIYSHISNTHGATEIDGEVKAQVQNIALEKACNRGMTFKNNQGHYNGLDRNSATWHRRTLQDRLLYGLVPPSLSASSNRGISDPRMATPGK